MLSVFDGHMARMNLDTGEVDQVDEAKYVNRHFSNGNERWYCVHFIRRASLDAALDAYDTAADELPRLTERLRAEFVSGVFSFPSRVESFWRALDAEFYDALFRECGELDFGLGALARNPIDIGWRLADDGTLRLTLDLSLFTEPSAMLEELNEDRFCRNLMRRLLAKYYGYSGGFTFVGATENDLRR